MRTKLIMEELLEIAQDREIAFLYAQIRQDPEFLHLIDQKQFVDTPLHIAAANGRTQLALEIQRLMPSFERKLNADGFTPIHVALHRSQFETVSAMIKLNPKLVCVQGRGGVTPLHYAAEIDDVHMLAEFLLSCPDSIEEMTIRGESAAHIAVKNGNLAAFRVLFGWVRRTGRREVLRWRDLMGNTVWHLAAYTNQSEVMELLVLIKNLVPINDKNSKGLTALDIIMEHPTEVNERALQILHCNRAKRGSSISEPKIATFADFLSSKVTVKEKAIKLGAYLDIGLSWDMRNAILVVAVLIATATYQAVLSPPGGFNDIQTPVNLNITNTSATNNNGLKTHQGEDGRIGKLEMQKNDFITFVTLNSTALVASFGMIFLVLPTRWCNLLLYASLFYLMLSYTVALKVISSWEALRGNSITVASFIFFSVIILAKIYISDRHLNVWASCRRLMGSNNYYDVYGAIVLVFHSRYSRSKWLEMTR